MTEIHLHTNPVGLTDSKFGGVPYLPSGEGAPCDADGKMLRLLAQIRTDEFPANDMGLPSGILQFWALDDDITGLCTDLKRMNVPNTHRVTFYEKIDESVTEEEVLEKYKPYCEDESYFPVQDTFGITFELKEEGISTTDFAFERKLTECWNRMYPDNTIASSGDIPDDIYEDEYNDYCGAGHKLGGYPMFTQWDPREGDNEDYEVLLLQIDSFGADGREIMWGDSGVGNFFIRKEDLRNKDFSKVLYSWDCY